MEHSSQTHEGDNRQTRSPIEEEDQVMTPLGSLPSTYSTIVTALKLELMISR